MVTIPNQSPMAKAFQEFDEAGRMKPSPYYDRVVDVMEALFKFTLLVRDRSNYLTNRYSERREAGVKAASEAAGLGGDGERREDSVTTMESHADVVVIGDGQTGLAVGYHLRQTGLSFVILDAGRLACASGVANVAGGRSPVAADDAPLRSGNRSVRS